LTFDARINGEARLIRFSSGLPSFFITLSDVAPLSAGIKFALNQVAVRYSFQLRY
jgi:hypothetical protein